MSTDMGVTSVTSVKLLSQIAHGQLAATGTRGATIPNQWVPRGQVVRDVGELDHFSGRVIRSNQQRLPRVKR